MKAKNLQRINSFLFKHHVLSLATSDFDVLSVCSLFYTYIEKEQSFIVASSEDTTHIKHIKINSEVAGNILLETNEVKKIQGVQFKGSVFKLEDEKLKALYFDAFPYSKELDPDLWKIKVHFFKMTDNTLGFGKKLIWKDV